MTTPITYRASDIITDALQKLGVYAPGEAVTDADMSRGLIVLNDMLDQWQNEFLFLTSLTAQTLNLSQGTPTYSIGPVGTAANIATGRPSRIQGGPGAASVHYSNTDYPVNVISQLQWTAIQSPVPSQSPALGVPDSLFYDAQYPVGLLNVSPAPNAGGMVLTFYKLAPFTSFALQSTSAMFSQGTADALKNNLALYAKPYFQEAGAALDQVVVARAEIGKEFVRNSGTTSRSLIKRAPSRVGKPSQTAAAQ